MSQTEGSDQPMKPPRKVYPKVRTGCDTCKQRKIKCDEGKPACRNCLKTGRTCLGYNPPRIMLFELPKRTSRLDAASQEKLLQYFKTSVATRLTSYRALRLGQEFWASTIPLLAEAYPPIRHAMLAVAATVEEHEAKYADPGCRTLTDSDPYFALEQYTEVLTNIRSGISELSISTEATLTCCLLLTLYDLWHLELPLTFQHVLGGLKLCQTIKKSSPSKSPLPDAIDIDGAIMIPAYRHLADYAVVSLDGTLTEQDPLLLEFEEKLGPLVLSSFADTDEAVALVDKLIRQVAKLDRQSTIEAVQEVQEHLSSLQGALQDGLNAVRDPLLAGEFRMLLVHCRAATILVDKVTHGMDMKDRRYEPDFEFIVSEIEIVLQIDNGRAWLGMIPPLFLTATTCRNSSLRYRALDAMHNSQQVERLWTSCTAYQIASRVVQLEESRFFMQNQAVSAANEELVELTSIYFDPDKGAIELNYQLGDDAEQALEQLTIGWEGDRSKVSAKQCSDPFYMPQRILQVCGYSALMLAFKSGTCHCQHEGNNTGQS